MLEINLLGPVSINYQGEPVHIKRKLERAILYYLAGEHRPISRMALIDLLWPKAEQNDPRASLRTALSRLRKALPEPDILETELDKVGLKLDCCKIDVLRFEIYHTSLRRFLSSHAENQPLPEQIVAQIQQAIALWQGDGFIQGDDLSSYPEVENWHQLRHRLLSHQCKFLKRRLADHYLAAGQLELALVAFIELGRTDLADTAIHQSIIEILTKLGRYQDAIDYCDGLEVRYEREYNRPLPEPILNRCQYAHILVDKAKKQERRAWPIPLTMHLQLIGRDSELDQLRGAFFRGGLVVVKGEMGTGKTRLVQELYETLTPIPTLLFAPSRERESALPFAPIVHCLRHDVPQDTWQKIEPIWANQLSLLLPELADIRADLDRTMVTKLPSGKQHLFDALLHAFKLTAQLSGRLLFFLDDAQWVDQQTLQVLEYLVLHGLFDHDGLLVIATRSEEPNRDLDELIDHLHRTNHIQAITLRGLNPNELSHLIEQVSDEPLSHRFVDQLFRETNGNPFIALEIIRNIQGLPETLDQFESHMRLPLPENVHAVIRTRLNHLEDDVRQILQCAAILGEDVSLSAIQKISGFDDQADIRKIESLVNSGFITFVETDDSQLSTLHFTHGKMREVVLKETSPMRLKILHLQAAQVLEQETGAISKSAMIADYFLSGGDIYQAFHWFVKAGGHAWILGSKTDANVNYQKAEEILKNAPEGTFNLSDILKLYEQWGQYAYESDQIEALEEIGITLQNLGEQQNHPILLGVAQITLAEACFLRFQFDIALDLVERAIENLNLTDHRIALANAYMRKSVLCWWKLKYEDAVKAAQQVLLISQSIEEDTPKLLSIVFHAKHVLCVVFYAQGEADKCLNLAEKIHREYMHRLDPYDRIRTLYMLGYAHLTAANYAQCAAYAQQGLDLARALNITFVEEILLYIIAKAEVIQGHLDEAFQHSTRALQLGEQYDHVHTIVTANWLLGDIFFHLNKDVESLRYYRMAQIREGYHTASLHGLENNIHLAHSLIKSGKFAEARDLLQSTQAMTQKTRMWQLYAQTLLISDYCDLIDGSHSYTEDDYFEAEEIARQKGLKYELLWCATRRAQLCLHNGHFERTQQMLKEVFEKCQELNTPWITLYALQLCKELERGYEGKDLQIDYKKIFKSLVHELEAHTQTDPLKKNFEILKKGWEEKFL